LISIVGLFSCGGGAIFLCLEYDLSKAEHMHGGSAARDEKIFYQREQRNGKESGEG